MKGKALIGHIVFVSLIVVSVVSASQVLSHSRAISHLKEERAEINRIKYGILSVNQWKEQLASIISKKIQEFEITEENKGEMKASVERALHRLLDEVKVALHKKKTQGNFWDKLKGEATSIFFNADDFRKDIPQFAEAVLKEFENPETRKGLEQYIKQKLDEFVAKTVGEEDLSVRNALLEKYGAQSAEEATQAIDEILEIPQIEQWLYTLIIIACVILGFLSYWILKLDNRTLFLLLIALTIIPLVVSVITPMIDIDARIDSFRFELMGEPLEFRNQVLYFQSKSIVDVVHILITKGGYDTILVGLLIMLFSVIFPLLKLASTVAVEFKRRLIENKILRFFVLKSAKWSMADVFVVSIFMAFIGFKGVIDSQLGQLERSEGRLDVLTTDNTSLQVGFSLFLCFTLAGLVVSSIADKRFKLKRHSQSA